MNHKTWHALISGHAKATHCNAYLNNLDILLYASKMYLSGCCDDILSARVTLEGLRQFAEQINAHFNCIKMVFAFCSRGGGGDK